MREDLICYALGELDEPARLALEAELAASPELRSELDEVCRCLHDLDHDECPCPPMPRGLADRTAHEILAACADRQPDAARCGIAAYFAKAPLSLVDSVVAVGVMVVMASLVIPAVCSSREASHRQACANNLMQLGTLFQLYARDHSNYFPAIGPDENAGMFSVRLAEANLMDRSELQKLLACAGQRLATHDAAADTPQPIYVPPLQELQQAGHCSLERLRAQMGGDFAYRIGYVNQGHYFPIRDRHDGRLAVLGDTPRLMADGYHSPNHVGGQNVLWEDGTVSFESGCLSPCLNDHLYLNTAGLPSAGTHQRDTVLAPSHATPGIGQETQPAKVMFRLLIWVK